MQTPTVHAGSTDTGLLWLEVVFACDPDDEPDAVELRVPVEVTRWARLDDRHPERAQVEAARICWGDASYVGDEPLDHAALRERWLPALRKQSWWPADDVLVDTWVSAGGPEAMDSYARDAAQ